jgi:hypothetical protein
VQFTDKDMPRADGEYFRGMLQSSREQRDDEYGIGAVDRKPAELDPG